MNLRRMVPSFALLPLLASCAAPPQATPAAPSDTPVRDTAPAPTASPTDTAEPSAPPMAPLELVEPPPEEVALDFVASMCDAEWSNNTIAIPCPGDPTDVDQGYIGRVDGASLPGGATTDQVGLLTIPASGPQLGIFGAYPPLRIQAGDHFRAGLACEAGEPTCEVLFGLGYYAENGMFHEIPEETGPISLAAHNETGALFTPVEVSLDALAGQRVRIVLIVRELGETRGGRALWIRPHIWRPASETSPEAASAIYGIVDMASAPPYLNDPLVTGGIGIPVVVVAFNLDDGTYFWVDTTPTHPEYSLSVSPGRYHLVAYAVGVADLPYVAGGYTGDNPSCGQALAEVLVGPGEDVLEIEIADWNWSCEGTAERPDKPPDVPIP